VTEQASTTHYQPGYQLIDGASRVTVGWSDEDAAWIARLTCDDAATHRVQFSPIGIGATQRNTTRSRISRSASTVRSWRKRNHRTRNRRGLGARKRERGTVAPSR
jgi:hypothetical protein